MKIVTDGPDDNPQERPLWRSGAAARSGERPSRAKRAGLLAATSLVLFSLTAGPVLAATASDEGLAPDPYEKTNRFFFYVNGALDFLLIRPASIFYKRVTPRPMRDGLRNAFSNMGEPVIIINDVLQGHGKKAIHSFARLAENSTIGVAGLIDVATANGLPHHDNDFGITLARRGVKSGPYVFLPVLGPGTVRDEIGYGINILLDPFTWLNFPYRTAVGYGRTLGRGLDERASADKNIKTIISTSTDPYASIRSFFLQNREGQISGGKVDLNALPAFDESGSTPSENAVPKETPPPVAPSDAGPPAAPPPSSGPGDAPVPPSSPPPSAPAPPVSAPPANAAPGDAALAPKSEQNTQALLIRTWRPDA